MNINLGLNMWDCITVCVLALIVGFVVLGMNAASNERKVKIAQAQAFAEAHRHGVEPEAEPDTDENERPETGTGKHRALTEDRAAAVKALSKKLYGESGEKVTQPESSLYLLPVKPLVKAKKKQKRGPLVSLQSGEVFEDEDPQEGINQTGHWAK